MNEIPRLSRKETVILELLLKHGEMYGLEMVKLSDQLARGTVYVTLGRMADKGFVESRTVESKLADGPPLRMYQATGLGQRVLAANQAAAHTMSAAWAT